MLIVSLIVGLWLVVASIANMGTDPETLVADIERMNSDSWRKALTLAQQLRDPDQAELRQDTDLARRLATLLEKQVDQGGEEDIRIYLCSALGKFDVLTGAPALVKAATTEKKVDDVEVRRAALQGIGTLVEQLSPEKVAEQPEMLAAVIDATDEHAEEGEERLRRELLRSTATYVLGVFPGDEAADRLATMLHDQSLDVGYNAAIGLARHGDVRALPLLKEMLDPPPEALLDESIKPDKDDPEEKVEAKKVRRQEWKKGHIIENGLRAIAKMKTDHPEADVESIKSNVQAVSDNEGLPAQLRSMAREVIRAWK